MADNSTQTGNDTIRTLDRSGIKTGVNLFDISQSGEAELFGLGDSITIKVQSAGLTTSTTAYNTGDTLGTELTFANAVRTGKGAVIQSALVTDAAKVTGTTGVDLFLFDAASTPAADNAANSWSDTNILKCLGVIHFSDVLVSANNHIWLATNLPVTIKPASSTSIFGVMVTRSGHTFFGAVTDLQVILGILRD